MESAVWERGTLYMQAVKEINHRRTFYCYSHILICDLSKLPFRKQSNEVKVREIELKHCSFLLLFLFYCSSMPSLFHICKLSTFIGFGRAIMSESAPRSGCLFHLFYQKKRFCCCFFVHFFLLIIFIFGDYVSSVLIVVYY